MNFYFHFLKLIPVTNICFFAADTGDVVVYSVKAEVECQKVTEGQSVTITFKNTKGQPRAATVDIPVIYGRIIEDA